jgi:hypothetical protein
MTNSRMDNIVNAVLYEGYILYPYRVSTKNHQRWTFGGLYPRAFCEDIFGADRASNQTECLIEGDANTLLDVEVRFLQVTERTPGTLNSESEEWNDEPESMYRAVDSLHIDDRIYRSWQEAEERRILLTEVSPDALHSTAYVRSFAFPSRRWAEPLHDSAGTIRGILIRQQQAISGTVAIQSAQVRKGVSKLTVRVTNTTELPADNIPDRDQALLRSLASCHTILRAAGGRFVSLTDPPDGFHNLAAACNNVGLWPVLVGEDGETWAMLASPIILADYPQVAAESPGDLFDGTEIDEILTLRILTLTDQEKQEVAGLDPRSNALLNRSETLARAQLDKMHGSMRSEVFSGGKVQ